MAASSSAHHEEGGKVLGFRFLGFNPKSNRIAKGHFYTLIPLVLHILLKVLNTILPEQDLFFLILLHLGSCNLYILKTIHKKNFDP